jgi:thiaminase/transcriptional activator TenA
MGFTTEAWSAAADVLGAIEKHPFVTGLADGTLSQERFAFYMAQDALYLADYSRMLALAASQAQDVDETLFWSTSAGSAVAVERALHGQFVADLSAAAKSPTCTAYTSYLAVLGTSGSYPGLVSGLLPCFWIYEYVGARLLETSGDLDEHPYGAWIGTYGDPAFAESSRRAREIVDGAVAGVAPENRSRMLEAFLTCARYEWMFWDSAWRLEGWPV